MHIINFTILLDMITIILRAYCIYFIFDFLHFRILNFQLKRKGYPLPDSLFKI